MKKIISYLLIMIGIFLIGNIAYADYDVPGTVEYEAVIINENGVEADYYGTSSTTIPYGTIVTVNVEYDGQAYVKYNDHWYTVDLDAIEPLSDPEELLEELKNDTDGEYEIDNMYVWKDGAYLYNGPSILYGKKEDEEQIPVGTLLEITRYSDSWGYVSQDEYEGWLYIYTSDEVAPYDMECSLTYIAYENSSHYYTLTDINLSSTLDGENVVTVVPAGEIIDSYFYSYYPDPHGKTVYISYNGIEGWYTLDENEIYIDYTKSDIIVDVIDDINIYEDLNFEYAYNSENVEGEYETILAGTEGKLIYSTYGDYYYAIYVDFDGVQGWVYSYGDYTYKSAEDEDIRDHIYYGGEYVDVSEFVITETNKINEKEVFEHSVAENIEFDNSLSESINTFENYLKFCIIGAVIVCIIAIIISFTINKGKKDKEEEVNSEVEEKKEE